MRATAEDGQRGLLLLVSLSLACGSEPPLDRSARAVIGGTLNTGDPAVVAIFAREPGARTGSLCTASLIAPAVLLTAAHCVMPELIGEDAELAVYTQADIDDGGPADISVTRVDYDPLFNVEMLAAGHDIGVLVLDRDLDVEPLPFNRTPLTEEHENEPVRIVGYGVTNGREMTGAGLKREASTRITAVSPLTFTLGDSSYRTCKGDSGGPTLMEIDGVETIVGVHSYADEYCNVLAEDTRVDAFLSFLDPHLGTCTPQCGGLMCGDDGCGGSCGTCAVGEICSAGICDTVCLPSCNGKMCGDDGCGGSCGRCGRGHACLASGLCVVTNICEANRGAESEPNDQLLAAGPLCINRSVDGSLGTPDDVDWYVFDLGPEHTYTVILTALRQDLRLDLYKEVEGTLTWLGSPDNHHDLAPQNLTRHASTGGRYRAKISIGREGLENGGSYTLKLYP